MKRSGFDINEIKNGFCIVVTITASVVWLGACGNTNVSSQQSNQPTQTTQTTEVTVEPTVDPVEPTVDPVEPEEFTAPCQVVMAVIEAQATSYPYIPKEEIVAVTMALNLDYIKEEDRDIIMDAYGLSYEDLNNYLKAFKARQVNVFEQSMLYHYGVSEKIDEEYDINNWIKYSDIALNSNDFELCTSVDEEFRNYNYVPNIKAEEDSVHITLNDMSGVDAELEETIFTQYVNSNAK